MTNEELINDCTQKFITMVNTEKLLQHMKKHAKSIDPCVLEIMTKGLPADKAISEILNILFSSVVREKGEKIAAADTAKYDELIEDTDPRGRIIMVAVVRGHVWIEAEMSDSPRTRIEISNYDNTQYEL